MDPSARLRSVLLGLREVELRVRYLEQELSRLGDLAGAQALDALCLAAEQADPEAREALLPLTALLARSEASALRARLRQAAKDEGLLGLGRLLRLRTPPSPSPSPPGTDPSRLPTSPTGRPLTLGERKSLARRPSRDTLERLFLDPAPEVTRQLLSNPRVTEDDVLRLAARRPVQASVLAEVARHPRWAPRARVRLALVQNPHTPPELAVPLLALLLRSELRQVVEATDLAPVVRAGASELLARRPPTSLAGPVPTPPGTEEEDAPAPPRTLH